MAVEPLTPPRVEFTHEVPMTFDHERITEALSSTYREFVFLTPTTTPRTLIEALQQQLPHIDPLSWEERVRRGGTYVNGMRVQGDLSLPCPVRIQYYEPKKSVDESLLRFRERIEEYVVFEDDELLVVYKPAGISSMPTREQHEFNLKSFLEAYLVRTSPGSSLHMPSRIDTSVEGLVVTSKSSRMHAALQRVYEHRRIEKFYVLESDRALSPQSLVANRGIDRDPRHPILRCAVSQGGQPARTLFRRIGSSVYFAPDHSTVETSLVLAQPVTGRTHQIRVHASSYGFPIIGDNFYGGLEDSRLHLASFACRFTHPHRHVPLHLVAPPRLLPGWCEQATALLPHCSFDAENAT